MAYKKVRKFAKKNVGRPLVKRYRKRYVGKSGGLKVQKMASDIMYLKSVLNPEKKRHQFTWQDGLVGQCNGNANAYFVHDITPNPAQGTTSTTRNGNSIKINSMYAKFQLQQQTAATTPIKFRFMIVKAIGQNQTASSVVTNMYENNSFVTGASIIDYNSDRNEEAYKQYIILRSKVVTLGAANYSSQQIIKTFGFGIKFKSHHVKFVADGFTTVQDGQIFLVVLADNGNVSATTASTLVGTASTAINTGAIIQADITSWFYDN